MYFISRLEFMVKSSITEDVQCVMIEINAQFSRG